MTIPGWTRIDQVALVALSFALLQGCSAALRDASKALDSQSRRPATDAELNQLSSDWQQFRDFIRVYEVPDANDHVTLIVVAVSALDYYESKPSGAETIEMPKPVILRADGKRVGALPFNFPDDPPYALEVTLAKWQDDWPTRIDLYLHDPTVSGDHALDPLVWDTRNQQYVTKTMDPN